MKASEWGTVVAITTCYTRLHTIKSYTLVLYTSNWIFVFSTGYLYMYASGFYVNFFRFTVTDYTGLSAAAWMFYSSSNKQHVLYNWNNVLILNSVNKYGYVKGAFCWKSVLWVSLNVCRSETCVKMYHQLCRNFSTSDPTELNTQTDITLSL